MAAALRKDVLRGAKQQGLSLRPDALRCAVGVSISIRETDAKPRYGGQAVKGSGQD